MYVRMIAREPHPRTWQEYEDLLIRSATDPNVVIGLRPAAWQEYARQFLRTTEFEDEDFGFDMAEFAEDRSVFEASHFWP